jgi:hypothetical protein
MDTLKPHGLTRDTAEYLLDGDPAGTASAPAQLARLLTAAASPARAGELATEDACVAAFRATRTGAPARSAGPIRTAITRILTLKVGIAALAATAGVGTALAAATSVLPPSPPDHGGVPVVTVPGVPVPGPSRTGPTAGRGPEAGAPAVPTTPAPAPSLQGLCRAYSAGNKAENGKALESPAFAGLVTAAGGPDRVAAYCAGLLGADAPGPGGKPGKGHPTGPPADRGGGPRATGKPTSHPGR